jgi:ribosomal protein S12 methylthiotransferase
MKKKVLLVSLGCDKNLVDSEMMLGLLSQNGYEFTDDESEADVAVVNTCCFINDAKEESIQAILDMAELKKEGQIEALIVAGCLAQRYREEIQTEIEEVDAVLGTMAIDEVVKTIDDVLHGKKENHYRDLDEKPLTGVERVVTTGGHYAYLKIAEGCSKHCTYCIIPKVRGDYRSVPMENLLKEAKSLADQGVRELILVAQETTMYGTDLYGEKSLSKLLRGLCEISGIYWIRILYCYPEEIDDELIRTIREEKKICHYLDIPIQHASDSVLKRMGRRTTKEELTNIVKKLRSEIPDICLRTTLITGFPGETQEEHEELMAFVDEMEFDRLGVFTYSQEEDTPAALMPDQIPEETKENRQAELMELQQEIAFDAAEDMKGRVVTAMVEGKVADEAAYVARTYKDAPNVDGFLFINTGRELMTGDFVKVRITGSYEYDLIGELEDESTE